MIQIPNEMLDAMRDEPRFLRVTPDGLDDGETLRNDVTAEVLSITVVKKLFVSNQLVHTSEDCDSDPNCSECNDRRARKYVRLRLNVKGRQLQLDVPPGATRRFLDFASDGIDAPVRLTCQRKERNGRTWGDIGFEIVKEAA